ncbi:MAG: hypothetical protein HRT64_10875 [Erythrobacter sp.]|nr:hypothetical protein [Erythrobacter sp.]
MSQIGSAIGETAPEYVDLSSRFDAALGQFGQIPSDVQMASTSNRKTLAKATSLSGAPYGPICSPFERLGGAV